MYVACDYSVCLKILFLFTNLVCELSQQNARSMQIEKKKSRFVNDSLITQILNGQLVLRSETSKYCQPNESNTYLKKTLLAVEYQLELIVSLL